MPELALPYPRGLFIKKIKKVPILINVFIRERLDEI